MVKAEPIFVENHRLQDVSELVWVGLSRKLRHRRTAVSLATGSSRTIRGWAVKLFVSMMDD